MRKVIYTKYSNDRDIKYNIATRIEVDEDGKRYVTKVAQSKESYGHIKSLSENYLNLQEVYIDTIIVPNRCEMLNDGVIQFEYCSGASLEKKVCELENQGRYSEAKALIIKFINALGGKANINTEVDDRFISLFGKDDYSLLKGKKCLKYSNVDILFSNIIIMDGSWVNIDYEWVYDFTIPVDFIIYRALKYSGSKEAKKILEDRDMVTVEEIELFDKMDYAFQKSVLKNHKPLGDLYYTTRKNTYPMEIITNELKKYGNANCVKVKYINSKDNSEKIIVIPNVQLTPGYVEVRIKSNPEFDKAVIEIDDTNCIFDLRSFGYDNGNVTEYKVNGNRIDDRMYVFNSEKPTITVDFNKSVDSDICMAAFVLKDNYAYGVGVNNTLSEMISKKNNDIMYLRTLVSNIENSLSYRITKPLRTIRNITRKK